jgi:hypothetical protein
MENRDKGKMGQDIKRDVPLDKNKSDSSAEFGQNIGRSETPLNEPSGRTSGSVGSGGMKGGSKLEKSSDLGSQDKWSDSDKHSGSSE